MQKLGVVYLPDADVAAVCERYAADVAGGAASYFRLGDDAAAHVTLLHVETEVESEIDVEMAWMETVRALPSRLTFSIFGLLLMPFAGDGSTGVMAQLGVRCTPELRAAEQRALKLPWIKRSRVTTLNNDDFQPHITLGAVASAPAMPELPVDLLDNRDVKTRLALVEIGVHGTVTRTRYSI